MFSMTETSCAHCPAWPVRLLAATKYASGSTAPSGPLTTACLSADTDSREGVKEPENIQKPQYDEDDDNRIQDRLDGALHGDEIHQPQQYAHNDQGQQYLQERHTFLPFLPAFRFKLSFEILDTCAGAGERALVVVQLDVQLQHGDHRLPRPVRLFTCVQIPRLSGVRADCLLSNEKNANPMISTEGRCAAQTVWFLLEVIGLEEKGWSSHCARDFFIRGKFIALTVAFQS